MAAEVYCTVERRQLANACRHCDNQGRQAAHMAILMMHAASILTAIWARQALKCLQLAGCLQE